MTPTVTPARSRGCFDRSIAGRPTVSSKAGSPVIAGVELTQVIQTFPIGGERTAPNSVPLIGGRPLVVRVYVDTDNAAWSQKPVAVQGRITLGAPALELAELAPFVPPAAPAAKRYDRTDAGSSLNFLIPGVRCVGVLDLTIEVSSGTQTFTAARRVRCEDLDPVPVIALAARLDTKAPINPNSYALDQAGLLETTELAGRPFPGPGLSILAVSELVARDVAKNAVPTEADKADRLSELAVLISEWRFLASVDALAIVLASADDFGTKDFLGKTSVGTAVAQGDWRVLAHELGHLLGRRHSPFGPQAPVDLEFPAYPDEPGGSIGDNGVDLVQQTPGGLAKVVVVRRGITFDYMGLGFGVLGGPDEVPVWSSVYGYRKVIASMRRRAWVAKGAPKKAKGLHIAVTIKKGLVESVRGLVLDVRLPMSLPDGLQSELQVDLLSATAQTLACVPLRRINREIDSLTAPLLADVYAGVVRWDGQAASIRIRRGSTVIAEQQVEPAPTISNLAATFTGERYAISWDVDPHPSSLRHYVRFSPDDGGSWLPVGSVEDIDDVSGKVTVKVDPKFLPIGPRATFEVISSGDIQSASDIVSIATPAGVSPSNAIRIIEPSTSTVRPGPVLLVGQAMAPGFGAIPPDRMIWRWNGSEIARGPRAIVSLPEGAGTLLLEAPRTTSSVTTVSKPLTVEEPPGGPNLD